MYNTLMKDINYVLSTLKEHNISQSEFAKSIGVARQSVTNWATIGKGIPKNFLLPTAKFLSKISKKKITVDSLLSLTINNDTKQSSNTTTPQGQHNGNR